MKTSVGISDLKSETDDGKKILVNEDVDKAKNTIRFLVICIHQRSNNGNTRTIRQNN